MNRAGSLPANLVLRRGDEDRLVAGMEWRALPDETGHSWEETLSVP